MKKKLSASAPAGGAHEEHHEEHHDDKGKDKRNSIKKIQLLENQ